jgi:hypothetical protein
VKQLGYFTAEGRFVNLLVSRGRDVIEQSILGSEGQDFVRRQAFGASLRENTGFLWAKVVAPPQKGGGRWCCWSP